jgi:hypothetical protein
MRKITMIIAAATIFAACNNTDLETKKDVVTTDSTIMNNSNVSTDTATTVTNDEPVVAAPLAPAPKVITRTKTVYVDRTPKTTAPVTQQQTNNSTVPTTNTGTTTAPSTTGTTTTGTTTAPVEKKEGMSNSTKGAIIGGVGGAVGGAIISKKKGKGAIIGGVIGAAGGYILGRKKDKKAAADTTK